MDGNTTIREAMKECERLGAGCLQLVFRDGNGAAVAIAVVALAERAVDVDQAMVQLSARWEQEELREETPEDGTEHR